MLPVPAINLFLQAQALRQQSRIAGGKLFEQGFCVYPENVRRQRETGQQLRLNKICKNRVDPQAASLDISHRSNYPLSVKERISDARLRNQDPAY